MASACAWTGLWRWPDTRPSAARSRQRPAQLGTRHRFLLRTPRVYCRPEVPMILRTLVAVLLVAAPVSAEVVRIEVKSRTPVARRTGVRRGRAVRTADRDHLLRDRSAQFGQPDHRRHRQGAAKRRRQGRVLVGLLPAQAGRSVARQRHGAVRSVESRRQGHGRVLQLRRGRQSIRRPRNSSATASCSNTASR